MVQAAPTPAPAPVSSPVAVDGSVDPALVPCDTACPLASLRRGQRGVVIELLVEGSDRALLDSMGLRTSARIRVCRAGRTCVVVAQGPDGGACRLGLERRLAERVMVAPAGA